MSGDAPSTQPSSEDESIFEEKENTVSVVFFGSLFEQAQFILCGRVMIFAAGAVSALRRTECSRYA